MQLHPYTAIAFAALLTTTALAQPPAFEVASVKPSPPPTPGRTAPANDPTLFAAHNRTLKQLIQRAYDVEDYQVSGGPNWTDTDRFDVDAKPENSSSPAEMLLMLRTLLADRFQLTFHRETRPVELNVLTVAKGGPKFGPQFAVSNEGDMPPHSGKSVLNHLDFQNIPIRVFITYLRMNMSRDPATGHTVGLQEVAPVLDRTGLTEKYNIVLDIGVSEEWPQILQHQLGLTVDLRKTPVEVLVIEGAAKPAGN